MNARIKKALLGVIALFLACSGIGIWAANQAWLAGVEQAARRVGADPTLNGIAEYIVASVEVGMPREKVEQLLKAIAPVEVVRGVPDEEIDAGWGPTTCDDLRLELTPLPGHEWRMFACYNQTGGLVLLKSADPDFPPLGISAPIQP